MQIPLSDNPGRHERHVRRRMGNDLFPQPVAEDGYVVELVDAQRQDQEELAAFQEELRDTVQEAVDLKANVDSDVVLGLKERLERLYEEAAGVAGDQQANKRAIHRLVEVITRAIRGAAAGDPTAEQELDQEAAAREAHFRLLEFPIVADLLHPESVIDRDELVPTLLAESAAGLAAALEVFDTVQLAQLAQAARELLGDRDPRQEHHPEAWQRLAEMEGRLASLSAVH